MRTTRRYAAIGALTAGALLAAGPAVAGDDDRREDRRGRSAYELTTADDTVDAAPGDGRCADADGECSLRAAVQEANSHPDHTTIELGGVTYTLTIAGAGEDAAATGDLDVTSPVTIDGGGAIVDANGLDRAFDVSAEGHLEVHDLTVTGGAPPSGESGGAFRSAGTLALHDAHVSGNTVVGTGASGGGVFNDGGDLQVTESTLSANSATRAGGGIEANAGSTHLDKAVLTENSTGPMPGNGGGLHLTGAGTVDVERTNVVANTASAEGGGLWNSASGAMTVSRSVIAGNTASGDAADQGGGGLFNDGDAGTGGTLIVERSKISDNVADGDSGSGGGILNDEGTLTASRTEITGNSSQRAGGGIEANVGTTSLDRVELSENTTGPNPGNGGGLHLTGAGTVEIDHSEVEDNSAALEGGGLWNSATGSMVVTDTDIEDNSAPTGPDVFNDGGTFTVDGEPVPAG